MSDGPAAGCLFCGFASRAIPVAFIHEDEDCVAVEDIAPRAPVHLLVIPKKHVAHALGLGPEDERLAGHLLRVGAALAKDRGLAEKGFRLVFNTLKDAGQTVFHLHLHVLGGQPLGPMC